MGDVSRRDIEQGSASVITSTAVYRFAAILSTRMRRARIVKLPAPGLTPLHLPRE